MPLDPLDARQQNVPESGNMPQQPLPAGTTRLKEFVNARKQEIWHSDLSVEEKAYMSQRLIAAAKKMNATADPQVDGEVRDVGARISCYVRVHEHMTERIKDIARADITDGQKEYLTAFLTQQTAQLKQRLNADVGMGDVAALKLLEVAFQDIDQHLLEKETALQRSGLSLPPEAAMYLSGLQELKLADAATTVRLEKFVNPLLSHIQAISMDNETKLLLSALIQERARPILHNNDEAAFELAMQDLQNEISLIHQAAAELRALVPEENFSAYGHEIVNTFVQSSLQNLIGQDDFTAKADQLKSDVNRMIGNLMRFQEALVQIEGQKKAIESLDINWRAKEALLSSLDAQAAKIVDKIVSYTPPKAGWLQSFKSDPQKEIFKMADALKSSLNKELKDVLAVERFKLDLEKRIKAANMPTIELKRLENAANDLYLSLSAQEDYITNWNRFTDDIVRKFRK